MSDPEPRPDAQRLTLQAMIARCLVVALRATGVAPAHPDWDDARTTRYLPIAESLLTDTELLDAIVAYRQGSDRRFTVRQIQDAVMAVLDARPVSLWLEHPQNTTTPCGSLHPDDAGHVARWVAETLTEEPTE